MEKCAVGVGYVFQILHKDSVSHIGLENAGTKVLVDGVEYEIYKGKTFKDSAMIDELLDAFGEKRISDYSD